MTDAPLSTDRVPPIVVEFRLLTNGADPELDAISIAFESFKQLDGDQIVRVLAYLTARFTHRG